MDLIRKFDKDLLDWFRERWGSRVFDGFMMDVTALGGVSVLILMTLFSAGLLFVLKRQRTAVFVLVVIVGGELLVAGFKQLVGRERPDAMHKLLPFRPAGSSFPSGHSMSSAIIYLTLALVATTPLTGRRGRVFVVGFAMVVVFLIGVSRVYLNVHYPTDVLAGWAAGLLWALGCRWIEDRWQTLRQEEMEPG